MKKLLCLILCFMMIPSVSFAEDDIKVTVDGNYVNFDQPPIIVNDRTLVPLRAIFEALGAYVSWDGEISAVRADKGLTSISLQIGSSRIYKTVNGIETHFDIDTYARLVNDRTLVPVRAVSEALGALVSWDNDTRTVIITSNDGGISDSFLNKEKTENDVKFYNVFVDYPLIKGNDTANATLKTYFEKKFNDVVSVKEKESQGDYDGSLKSGWFFMTHTYNLTFELISKNEEKADFKIYETNYNGGVDSVSAQSEISVNLVTGKISEK